LIKRPRAYSWEKAAFSVKEAVKIGYAYAEEKNRPYIKVNSK
jgi:hypothetical protein